MAKRKKKPPKQINLNELRLNTRKSFEINPATQIVPNGKKKKKGTRKQRLQKRLKEDGY